MLIFKIIASFTITIFMLTKFVIADELEDRVKELEAKIAQMEMQSKFKWHDKRCLELAI